MWCMPTSRMLLVLVATTCCWTRLGHSQTVAAPKSETRRNALPASNTVPSRQADGSDSVPTVMGFQTRVLKEGEKVPERNQPDYEDWSKPELTPGMRIEVVPLAFTRGDGFTRELVSVQWREMDPIDLWIIKPAGSKHPPVIVYLYSYNGNNQRYKDDNFCRFLTKDGFAAVGFPSAVTEQRFHDRPLRETFVSQLQESLGATTHDVQMILNVLEKRGDFDTGKVGLWADGSGASIAIMAAAVDPRIKVLDLLNPWGDWPEWLAQSSVVPDENRPLYLSPQFLGLVDGLDPLKWFPKLKTPKIRLQYIKNGMTVTPAIVREKMEAAAPANTEFVHYQDAKAFLSDVALKGRGFDWIKRELGNSSQTENAVFQNSQQSQSLKQ